MAKKQKSPNKGIEYEVALCAWLRVAGYRPVKHDVICKGKTATRAHQCDIRAQRAPSLSFVLAMWSLSAVVAYAFFPGNTTMAEGLAERFSLEPMYYAAAYGLVLAIYVYFALKSRSNANIWIECKNLSTNVKRSHITKLHATVNDVRAYDGAKWKPDEVWVVTNNGFDQDALSFAREYNISCYVWGGHEDDELTEVCE
jgi:hypothetical protein